MNYLDFTENIMKDVYRNISQYSEKISQYIAIRFSCIVTPLLENIGTCVKITWNHFPCLVLHKVKFFIDYAQGLVQLLLLIFTSMISFLHCLSS